MRISREEAIEAVGEDAVTAVENGNVDYTGRLTDGTKDNGFTEFSCSVGAVDVNGDVTLTMYVFVDSEDLAANGDEDIDWGTVIADTAEFSLS